VKSLSRMGGRLSPGSGRQAQAVGSVVAGLVRGYAAAACRSACGGLLVFRLFSIVGSACVAAVVLASVDVADAWGASPRAAAPVPSLTPAATARLWERLVTRQGRHRFATADCRPVRVVFYAATDWRRLATKVAANSSPCAHYYVSVPPLVADKSQPRAGEGPWIRALGPSVHALAEINVTGWTRWVADTGNTWYEAGVEARRRMELTGYSVAAGDTWALNELSSAVRAGTGNARANMRAFLNGLHDGDGGPPARGVVFTAGIGQATSELSVYRARLQEWFEDEAFWADMARVTRDWSQEVYGDVRHYAVAGLVREARRDALNEYLQHQAALASAAPPPVVGARAVLGGAYAPVANAAWRFDEAFGWTDVDVELMQDYVSAQTYALRSTPTAAFGFAWSPRNLTATPDFPAQTDALLERLAAAIAGSSETPDGACGSDWCTRELAGAAVTTAWHGLGVWSPSRIAFTSAPQTLAPGAVSAPITMQLQTTTGVPYTAGAPVGVELSTTSATAELAGGPAGPWTPTLATTIASGVSGVDVYVRDPIAGSSTLTATASGKTAGTQALTVAAEPAPPPPPPPAGGGGGGAVPPDVAIALTAATSVLAPNEPVEIRVTVSNGELAAATGLAAHIALPPEATLLGPPAFDRGSGCIGTVTLDCRLDYLPAGAATLVRFSIAFAAPGTKTVTADAAAGGGDRNMADNRATLTLQVAAPLAPPQVSPNRPSPRRGVTRTGTSARDVLVGTAQADRLSGRGGADRLVGRGGADLLAGGAGADRLLGGAGRDVLDGGSGDDSIAAADGVRDTIRCGRGRDTVVADRRDSIARDCERVRRRG
jgi:hypothetical protein